VPPDIVLDGAARPLVVLHALASIVLIGASTHHAIIAVGYLRGRYKLRLGRIYAATVAIAYGITFLLGLGAYPTFRYHVRGLYLDRYAPWASNLFDTKENFAALGIPLVVAAYVLSRVMKPDEDRALARGYAAIVVLAAAIVWFAVISGIAITITRGV
jgi:type IV secretory pathway TrbD component